MRLKLLTFVLCVLYDTFRILNNFALIASILNLRAHPESLHYGLSGLGCNLELKLIP